MIFILKEEPLSFHLRGQPTFCDQNWQSYPDFTVGLQKHWFWWRHRQNMMTSSKKPETSYIFFDPCLMCNKTAKFDGVWAKTSGDNRVGKFTHSPHREKMPIYFVRDCSFRLLLTFLCSLSVCLLSGLSLTSNCLLIGWAETVRCLICWMLELT